MLPGTAPEKTGCIFDGWYYDSAFTKSVKTTDTVKSDATVYTKWVEEKKVVTAEVTAMVKDDATPTSAAVSGATVNLMKGDAVYKTTTTKAEGGFKFEGVPVGTYQIVVTDNTVTTTALVVIDAEGKVLIDGKTDTTILKLCNSGGKTASSEVEVKEGTSDIIAGGLEKLAESEKTKAVGNIMIKLTVEAKEESEVVASEVTDIKVKAGSGKTIEFIDMTLTKTVDNTEDPIFGDTNTQLITIVIPFDFSNVNVSSVKVIRRQRRELHGNAG